MRCDLDTLAEQGVVQRVRGGAVALGPQPFAERYGHAAWAMTASPTSCSTSSTTATRSASTRRPRCCAWPPASTGSAT